MFILSLKTYLEKTMGVSHYNVYSIFDFHTSKTIDLSVGSPEREE